MWREGAHNQPGKSTSEALALRSGPGVGVPVTFCISLVTASSAVPLSHTKLRPRLAPSCRTLRRISYRVPSLEPTTCPQKASVPLVYCLAHSPIWFICPIISDFSEKLPGNSFPEGLSSISLPGIALTDPSSSYLSPCAVFLIIVMALSAGTSAPRWWAVVPSSGSPVLVPCPAAVCDQRPHQKQATAQGAIYQGEEIEAAGACSSWSR